MSFGWTALAVSAFSAVSANVQANKSRGQAKAAAAANAQAADEANNRANRKAPDSAAAMAAAILAGKSGQSGTMLTGPSGVPTDSLMLGKSTLLGS